jgi:hypothetical protein
VEEHLFSSVSKCSDTAVRSDRRLGPFSRAGVRAWSKVVPPPAGVRSPSRPSPPTLVPGEAAGVRRCGFRRRFPDRVAPATRPLNAAVQRLLPQSRHNASRCNTRLCLVDLPRAGGGGGVATARNGFASTAPAVAGRSRLRRINGAWPAGFMALAGVGVACRGWFWRAWADWPTGFGAARVVDNVAPASPCVTAMPRGRALGQPRVDPLVASKRWSSARS